MTLTAALAAHQIVAKYSLTWHDLLTPAPIKREPLHRTLRKTCAQLATRQADLREWEKRFIADLSSFPCISSKQRNILNKVAARILRGAP